MESLKKYVLNNFSKKEIIEEWTEGVEDLFYPDFAVWENKVIFTIEMIAEMV